MGFAQVTREDDGRLRCDGGCGRRMPAGAWTFECTACDEDICVACANDEDCLRAVARGGRGAKRRGEESGSAPRRAARREGQGGEPEGVRRRKAKRKRPEGPGLEPGPS